MSNPRRGGLEILLEPQDLPHTDSKRRPSCFFNAETFSSNIRPRVAKRFEKPWLPTLVDGFLDLNALASRMPAVAGMRSRTPDCSRTASCSRVDASCTCRCKAKIRAETAAFSSVSCLS